MHAKMVAGDENARDTLFRSCAPLAIAYAFSRIRTLDIKDSGTIQDLVQQALFGLLMAVDSFDPSRGGLATYSRKWIRGYFWHHLRSVSRYALSELQESGYDDRDAVDRALDVKLTWKPLIWGAIPQLIPSEREAVLGRFNDETYEEMSQRTGKTRQCVHQRYQRGTERMRAALCARSRNLNPVT